MLSAQRWPIIAALGSTSAVLEPTIPIIFEIASETVELGLVVSVIRQIAMDAGRFAPPTNTQPDLILRNEPNLAAKSNSAEQTQ
jgi:hypothetical protein